MGRSAKRKKVRIDEYNEDARNMGKRPLLEQHTEFGENTVRKTIQIPVTNASALSQRPFNPSLKAVDSPTPRLDWVLQTSGEYYPFIDSDIDLQEMATCQLEALGLFKYVQGKVPSPVHNAEKVKTPSVPSHYALSTVHVSNYT